MKTRVLKISELKFDAELYPRIKVDWLTAYQYAQAMRAGGVFPPIVVGELDGALYVVDGWHRVEAKKMLGEQYIEGTVKRYNSKRDMFVDAIKMNVVHGRPLSPQEKVRLIKKLEDLNFTREQISEIILVPIDKIERFKARTVIGPNGKPVFLKSVVAKAVKSPEDAIHVDMDKFNVRSVVQLLEQLIELLESNIYPLEDENVKTLTVQLYSLLQEKLGLTVEAR